jgi:predicted trehalose synthase
MRTLPNSLNVFGTIGAIGAAGALVTAASAKLKDDFASGTVPAAARPSVKRLRVRISCMKFDLPR